MENYNFERKVFCIMKLFCQSILDQLQLCPINEVLDFIGTAEAVFMWQLNLEPFS